MRLFYLVTTEQFKRRVHTFPKGIKMKVNVIMRLELELAYYDVAVQHVNHYTKETTPVFGGLKKFR